ncbi:TonB-dependent receptor [Microbulbifer sp. 2205BS26-8]|uniref:TonB-dependent receptor n=1 Tax=Microbulbifer sp. 2205BS26-8 TaxID=3064386 RepID=UPI00273F5366|nr:TonB-dependent receptor [Microbulbifer sp. 2205BS26-8]MDP5208604.1 TonB-dependent receptor [Microbulbifer sp. 2205BS26-8]
MKKTLMAAAVFAAAQPLMSVAKGLEEIHVTASRLDVPKSQLGASVSVLDAADIERLGYSSLMDVLRTLPGVAATNSGGAGKVSSLFLRGESSFRTLVLLDGVNIADPTGVQVSAQLQHLQASDIDRIEVLRGPQGMLYGAGAGGVINIISKKAAAPLSATASIEAGRYGTRNTGVSLGGSHDAWSFDLDVLDFSTGGFNARESDFSGEEDGYDTLTTRVRLGYQFSERLSLEGQYRRTDAETEYDNCGFPPSNDCLSQFDQEIVGVSGQYQAASWNHKLTLSQQEIDRKEGISPEALPFFTNGEIREVNYVGSNRLAGGKLLWGGEYEQLNYFTGSVGVTYGDEVLESTGWFTEWHSDFAETVFYTLGYRRDSLETEDHNSWRVTAALPVSLGDTQQLKYRASFGTGYRAPSPYEFSTNEALGPETSQGYELGLEYRWAQLLQVEMTYFEQEITDAIFYDSVFWRYDQDDGESKSEGLELSLGGDLNNKLAWYLTGTWLDTEDTTDAQRGGVPRRVYNVGFSQQWFSDKLTLNGNWQRVEGRIDGFTQKGLEDYSKLDLNAVYRLSPNLRISLRGENLLDRRYREVAGYYTTGAAVYAGVQISL